MPFSVWWLLAYLHGLGWPRKRGLLRRRPVVSALVLDGAIRGLAHVGCGLGASRPDLAARGIAQALSYLNRDALGADDLLDLFDRTAATWDEEGGVPWEVLAALFVPRAVELARLEGQRGPPQAVVDPEVDLEVMDDPSYYARVSMLWAGSLYFGMTDPADVQRFTEAELQEINEDAPRWRAVGLNIPATNPWANVDAFYENCREFISTYEATVEPLPPIPAQLQEALAARLEN